MIDDLITGPLRDSVSQVVTGLVLAVAIVIGCVVFVAPFVVAGLVINAFGLADGPNAWLGSVLIVMALAAGVVALFLTLRRIVMASRPILALGEPPNDAESEGSLPGPSSDVAESPEPTRARAAEILALDARFAPPEETASSRVVGSEADQRPGMGPSQGEGPTPRGGPPNRP